MYLFLVTVFIIYAGMHHYLFLKTNAAFDLGPFANIALILFMAGMVFSPVIIYRLERYGLESAARLTAYIGYTWMGVVFRPSRDATKTEHDANYGSQRNSIVYNELSVGRSEPENRSGDHASSGRDVCRKQSIQLRCGDRPNQDPHPLR